MSKQPPQSFLAFILFFLKPYKWVIYSLLFLGLLSGSYGTVNSYLIKLLIDHASTMSNNIGSTIKITLLPGILLVFNYEIHNLTWRGINYINMTFCPRIRKRIILKIFSYVHDHSFNFFQDNFSGAISKNIEGIADNVEDIILHLSPFIFRGAIQLLLALITMGFIHPSFSIALFIWAACFLVVSFCYSNKIKLLSDNYAKNQTLLSGKITDGVLNVSSVKLFSRGIFESNYLKKYLNYVTSAFREKEWYSLRLWWYQGTSITILIGVLVYTLIKLRTYNLVTIGDFAFILGLALYLTENVWHVTEQLDKLNGIIGQFNQSLKMILIPHEIIDDLNATELSVTKGKIIFNNVTFGYKKTMQIFDNKSMIIPGGQKVGLVGLSGAGKTTFISLIVRLFDLSSGYITIDGQDISKVTQNSLRESIGFIPQDAVLFNRSLMENIRYGKINASDEEVISAAKKAHAHEFIVLTSDGYDSIVGERGLKLSGGQRQRISIARAILKDAPILILDEATSSLDSITEKYIQDSLSNLMQSKTVIVVAHRLSTLLSMDRILVFEKGRIIEDGSHEKLMIKNGLYALLWNQQIGGFLPNKISNIEFQNANTYETA